MNESIFSNNLRSLHKLSVILATSCLVLSSALILLYVQTSSIKDRVVIVPPGLSGPVSVDWGKADAEYIKTFAVFYSTLVGSINPRNVEYVADRLSSMTAISAYPQIRRSLLTLAKDPLFMDQATSSSFISNSLVYEVDTNKVFVLGEIRVQGSVGQARSTPTIYEMKITIEEGRPIVHSVDNYVGTTPHTAQWIIENPDWNKQKDTFK